MRKKDELRTIGTLEGIVAAADRDNMGVMRPSGTIAAQEPGAADAAICAFKTWLPAPVSFVCRERWIEQGQRWKRELMAYEVVNQPSREVLAATAGLARIAMRPPAPAAIRLLADAIYRTKLARERGSRCWRRAG